ncbi:MAG TPA: methyltransferase domain-containing protein [Acidimicrobiales bacterium]|nr:methyltransferase domain-containing protein [Acidimicrobiales bacterium]
MDINGREFEALAAHARLAYLRYSFTKGTEQEVDFLIEAMGLRPGHRLLDVGCGPGRHSHAMRARGIEVVGFDLAHHFLVAAGPGVWVRGDARELPFARHAFDAAITLCQGGFGLLGGADDAGVIAGMAAVVRPGGRIAASAFSSYFAVRYLEDSDDFDADRGVNHELAEVKDESGRGQMFDLWTTCFTPRELRFIARAAGVAVEGLWAVTPGDYGRRPPDLDHPEFLLLGAV